MLLKACPVLVVFNTAMVGPGCLLVGSGNTSFFHFEHLVDDHNVLWAKT